MGGSLELHKFKRSLAAEAEGVCHTANECDELYRNINPEIRGRAVAFLREWLGEEAARIKALIARYGERDWLSHLYDDEIAELGGEDKKYGAMMSPHFGVGMLIRNALRRMHFGEDELGVHNLDCVYVQLVAEAVMGEQV